jgi:hypothetical protein
MRVMMALWSLAVLPAVTACGGHPSAPQPAGSPSALSTKSYNAGVKAGESISLPNETAAQMQANCEATAVQRMSGTDLKSAWLSGCVYGIIQAEIQSGSSG